MEKTAQGMAGSLNSMNRGELTDFALAVYADRAELLRQKSRLVAALRDCLNPLEPGRLSAVAESNASALLRTLGEA